MEIERLFYSHLHLYVGLSWSGCDKPCISDGHIVVARKLVIRCLFAEVSYQLIFFMNEMKITTSRLPGWTEPPLSLSGPLAKKSRGNSRFSTLGTGIIAPPRHFPQTKVSSNWLRATTRFSEQRKDVMLNGKMRDVESAGITAFIQIHWTGTAVIRVEGKHILIVCHFRWVSAMQFSSPY